MFRTQGNTRRNSTHRRSGGRGKSAQKRTPFCKVCHDAGKSKEVYTSHYVKDRPGPLGKVCCPYLLSLVCRYCHKTGHTPNHCPEVRAKENRRCQPQEKNHAAHEDGFQQVRTPKGRRPRRHNRGAPKKTPRNIFSSLADVEPEEKETKPEFPALKTQNQVNSSSQKKPALTGWSTMAAKAPVVKEEPNPTVIASSFQYKPLADGGKSWADMMDEEEEEQRCRDAWYDTDEDEYDYDQEERYNATMTSDEEW